MKVYIDLNTGTVLKGPVCVVDIPESDIDAIMDSDTAARDYAIDYGRMVN